MKLDRAVNSKQLAAETRSMPHILMHQMRALSGFLFEAALLRNSNVCSEFLLGLLTLIALFIRCSKFSWCLMVLCFFCVFGGFLWTQKWVQLGGKWAQLGGMPKYHHCLC